MQGLENATGKGVGIIPKRHLHGWGALDLYYMHYWNTGHFFFGRRVLEGHPDTVEEEAEILHGQHYFR